MPCKGTALPTELGDHEWDWKDLNLRHTAYQAGALTGLSYNPIVQEEGRKSSTDEFPRPLYALSYSQVVDTGFEPAIFRMSSERSTN